VDPRICDLCLFSPTNKSSSVCSGKTLLDGKLAVDNAYSDRGQLCRSHVTAPVIRQESCATDEADCVSLCTVDNRQLSLDRISRITDHPAQSTWISWIDWKQPINRGGVVIPEYRTAREEMTELKAVWALDERRHDGVYEQQRGKADAQVTDCWTSECGEVRSRVDSGISLLTRTNGERDNNATLKSDIRVHNETPLICVRPRELSDMMDSGCDGGDWLAEDDDTLQLKLHAERSTSHLSARTSTSPVVSVQCSTIRDHHAVRHCTAAVNDVSTLIAS